MHTPQVPWTLLAQTQSCKFGPGKILTLVHPATKLFLPASQRFWMLSQIQVTMAKFFHEAPDTLESAQYFKGRPLLELENEGLCMDVAHGAVDFCEDPSSQCLFPGPKRESWVCKVADPARVGNHLFLPSPYHQLLCIPDLQRLPSSLLPQ